MSLTDAATALVKVQGPDGKRYGFPKGTTKDQAVAYFKAKGIGAPAKAPATQSSVDAATEARHKEAEKPWLGIVPHDVDIALQKGVADSFGIKFADPQHPEDLTAKQMFGQMGQGIGQSFKDSLKKWGPLAPVDMIAEFIEGTASGIQSGIKEAIHGPNRESHAHGVGVVLGGLGQLFSGAEGGEAPSKINGVLKVVDTLSKTHNLDPANTSFAKEVANAHPTILKPLAYGRAYLYKKGLDIGNKITKARAEVGKEIDTHAQGMSTWLEKNVPQGPVDPKQVVAYVDEAWKNVQTKEKMPTNLARMYADAKTSIKNNQNWSFEKLKQYRTSLADDYKDSSSAVQSVVGKVRDGATKTMGAVAKKYGLEDAFNKYNRLQKNLETFRPFMDDIHNQMQSGGLKVAQKAIDNSALFKEMGAQLSKYGLDYKEMSKFLEDSKWFRTKEDRFKSIWRIAHGSPGGLTGFIGSYALTKKYLPSLLVGAATGFTSEYFANLYRALKLDKNVLEEEFKNRVLEGKSLFKEGKMSTGEEPPAEPAQPSAPATPPQLPSGGPPVSAQPIDLPGVAKEAPSKPSRAKTPKTEPTRVARGYEGPVTSARHAEVEASSEKLGKEFKEASFQHEITRLERAVRESPNEEEKKIAQTQLDDTKKQLGELRGEPQVTKAAPGEHGKGRIAEQSKARERIERTRGTAMRSRKAEINEAAERVVAKGPDLSQVGIPELEEFVEKANPTAYSGLQKLLKAGRINHETYVESLKHFSIEAYENLGKMQ